MSSSRRPRVAICQPAIIRGGRLRVICGMVACLNRMGITPEIVTSAAADGIEDLGRFGDLQLEARWRLLRSPRRPGEAAIALFNRGLARVAGDYDLLINTSNSLLFLPRGIDVLSYVFFPRKARVMSDAVSIHRPGQKLRPMSARWLERRVLRFFYHLGRPSDTQDLVCMTRFTADAVARCYQGVMQGPVIYPPVDLDRFAGEAAEREALVVSAGRFVHDKNQLQQIEIARGLPKLHFDIAGFSGDGAYLRICRRYLRQQQVDNVTLHADLPLHELQALMSRARYFLHTTVAEPFGLTAVQAMAAGCVPLVHDSGGQRETVPDAELRFVESDEVAARIEGMELDRSGRVSRLEALQSRARELFASEVFVERFSEVLEKALAGESLR